MSQVGIRELRKYLSQKSAESLVEEIVFLLKTFPEVKEYYQVKLSPKGDLLVLEKYKKIIFNEFFPSRGFGKLNLTNIHKTIRDYKKVSGSIEGIVELMLYFVEQGTKFIHTYGDIAENFYGSMESAYQQASEVVSLHGQKEDWINRFEQLVAATADTGYGFGDTIRYMFKEYFEDNQ
jgi:hypothetical protein